VQQVQKRKKVMFFKSEKNKIRILEHWGWSLENFIRHISKIRSF